MKPVCKHCERWTANKPRGLCQSCYNTPGVREMYPSTSKFARRGLLADNESTEDPPLAKTATETCPGSLERQEVYTQRIMEGRAMFHPDDKSDFS